MTTLEENPSYLATPARKLIVSWMIYSAVVVAIFFAVDAMQARNSEAMPLLTALPGLSLGGYLVILLRYFSHYDEMLKSLLLKSLSASALTGFTVQLSSLVRADITALKPFDDALVIVLMAVAFIITALTLKWKYR